jgi:hypothetical protein
MKNKLLNFYRRSRVKVKKWLGIEPHVSVQLRMAQEFHGNEYCGWSIPAASLRPDSVVVDVGIGEGISFSTSLWLPMGASKSHNKVAHQRRCSAASRSPAARDRKSSFLIMGSHMEYGK